MTARIHPTAIISPDARIGADVEIGPWVLIGEGCTVGDGCVIGARAALERYVTLAPRVKVGIGSVLGGDPHAAAGGRYGQIDHQQANRAVGRRAGVV